MKAEHMQIHGCSKRLPSVDKARGRRRLQCAEILTAGHWRAAHRRKLLLQHAQLCASSAPCLRSLARRRLTTALGASRAAALCTALLLGLSCSGSSTTQQ